MGKLEGKVALVTGSGRTIGRATVLKLAGEGAHVVVNARANQHEAESVAREARDLGVKAVPILADVGKKAEVESLAARALSEFGRVTRGDAEQANLELPSAAGSSFVGDVTGKERADLRPRRASWRRSRS